MYAVRKKVKRFVLDVNTFITIFLNRDTDKLKNYIVRNSLEIYVDKILLDELENVLSYPKIKQHLTLNTFIYMDFIQSISIQIEAQDYGIECPDANDNYLYNLALTANAKLLITGDKLLLNWENTPVETISLSLFKQLF
jgi:putative PIN family toxin of toxin-antitoxin system